MAVFSDAYAAALAAVCGYTINRPNIDDDSIDMILSSKQKGRPHLSIQLKSTHTVVDQRSTSESFPFRLSAKNYDDLRIPMVDLSNPRILLVLLMPESPDEWLEHGDRHMLLRHDAFYLNLRDQPIIATETTTVHVPWANALTLTSLREMMDYIAANKDLP